MNMLIIKQKVNSDIANRLITMDFSNRGIQDILQNGELDAVGVFWVIYRNHYELVKVEVD